MQKLTDEEVDVKKLNEIKYDFTTNTKPVYQTEKGISRAVVEEISKAKNEPDWMRNIRLKALDIFLSKPVTTWGPDLSELNFDELTYFIRPEDRKSNNWEDVPKEIKDTFDKLGVPEMEKKYLAGSVAQLQSEGVYSRLRKQWEDKGVIFMDMDSAVKSHPDIVREHFGKIVPPSDNKFAALNTAVWSGGSFLYVPSGVHLDLPVQAYFRMNGALEGQFERTLIITEPDASVHYIEGCLPAEELVSKGDSFVPISSVNKSEDVMTHSGENSKVIRTFERPYDGTMMTFTPLSSGNAFKLTVEHPVLAIKRKSVAASRKLRNGWRSEVSTKKLISARPEYIRAEELAEGDFIVYVAPTGSKDSKEMTPEVLKVLGLYTAAGSVSINKALKMNVLAFSFGKSKKGKELATDLYETIKSLGEQVNITKVRGGYFTVVSYSKKLIELCETHVGKGTAWKKLSKVLMELPPEKQKILLDNYLKGNGNVYAKKPSKSLTVRASTASKMLAFQLQEIIARNGIFANLSTRKGGEDTIPGRTMKRSDKYIVEYKENKRFSQVRKVGNDFYVPIRKIVREKFKDKVYNLEVKDQNSYLVKGFAVHNCTAPTYSQYSLHAAIVEVYVKKGGKMRYTSIQNWSDNIINGPTKRSWVEENGQMEWVQGSLGSKITMTYPSSILRGPYASTSNLNVALGIGPVWKDSGAKVVHAAPNTSSKVVAKSISGRGGMSVYRGQLRINPGAYNSKASVQCDALILDDISKSNTYPHNEILEESASFSHEASVGKISEDQVDYLMSRGIREEDARSLIVLGFLDDVLKEIPLEYSIEFNKLVKLEMNKYGAVG